MWRISGKCWYQKRHISWRQFVTIAICTWHDTLDPDIKKSKIRVYLEKWRKVEPPCAYGWFNDLFFSIWLFFHEHSRITGLHGKGEIISLTSNYDFHSLHRHLYISRAINAEGLPLLIASSYEQRTFGELGTIGFQAQVANH